MITVITDETAGVYISGAALDLTAIIFLFVLLTAAVMIKKNYFFSFAGVLYSVWFGFTQIDHGSTYSYLFTAMVVSLVAGFLFIFYHRLMEA